MLEKLVIYLHTHAANHPDWAVINADGVCAESVTRGDPAMLAALAQNRNVTVLVPAESILLTSVTLPKMNEARLMKALPFALEEHLVDDIEHLHFAASKFQDNGQLSVAVITHDKMQTWLAMLAEWQIKPDVMTPVTLALPLSDNALHIAVDNMADVRVAAYSGFASEPENLMTCLNLAFTDDLSMPAQIIVHNASGQPIEPLLKVTAKVDEKLIQPEELIQLLGQSVAETPHINLLQGNYAVKQSRLPQTQRLVFGIKVLVASWLLLLVLYPAVSYLVLGGKLNQINSHIAEIYKRHFPQSASITAPKLRMDDKLRQLANQSGENRLLLLMGYIGEGLHHAKNVNLKRIDFQNGLLTLQLSAASSDDFSKFSDYLSAQGLSVKQENATLVGTRVNATLQVE